MKEFVNNPSETSKILVNIVDKLNKEQEDSLKGLKKIQTQFKFQLYIKEDYKKYYQFLKNYNLQDSSFDELCEEFESLYRKLLFNNYALAYAALKEEINNSILTKEDEKNIALSQLYRGEISRKTFNKKFGHYAINAYELEAKRFEEYTDEELNKIARLASKLPQKEKISFEEYRIIYFLF